MDAAGVPDGNVQFQEVGLFCELSEKVIQPGIHTCVDEAVMAAMGGAQGFTVIGTAAVLVHPLASVIVTV